MIWQMEYLNSLSIDDQLEFLRSGLASIEDTDEFQEEMEKQISDWSKGNIEAFAEARDSAGESTTAYLLTKEREQNMAKTIEGYFDEDDTYFVVVGALHLVGEGSVPDSLSKKGIRWKRAAKKNVTFVNIKQ